MLHSTGERNSIATTLATDFNSGTLKLYTGAAPGTADAAETGTLLVTIALGATAYGAVAAGVITLSGTPLSAAIAATGTAGYGRQLASGDTGVLSTTQKRMQYSVGTSATEMIVNTNSLVNGGTFTLTAGSWTAPS